MTAPTSRSDPTESLLDLSRLVAGVRWRRRGWMALGIVGMILGAVVAVLGQTHTAVVRILVIHEDDQAGGSGSPIETDVALLETTRIAAAALDQLGAPDRPDSFLRSFTGEALTENVLEISVRAPTDADALARADALADVFIADHLRRTEETAGAESRALIERRDIAEADLATLNTEIADVAAQAAVNPADAGARLESLYARRAALADQIQDFAQRADDAGIGAPRVAAGTQVVDPPRVANSSRAVAAVVNSMVGLILGMGIGLAVAAVAALVKDRPILRRDIAAELGASVIAQLSAPRRGPSRLRRRSRPAAERSRAAATLARLLRQAPGGTSLLEIGCPDQAAALAVEMAREVAVEQPVVVVDDLAGDDLARAAADLPESDRIRIVDSAELESGAGRKGAERLLGVGSVGPGSACTDLDRLGRESVLVVRAGHASALWLHTVARHLADQEILVLGLVLVHPDPRDRTDGTLWDALHTALRGRRRASPPMAPAHANGTPVRPTWASPGAAATASATSVLDPPTTVLATTAPSAAGATPTPTRGPQAPTPGPTPSRVATASSPVAEASSPGPTTPDTRPEVPRPDAEAPSPDAAEAPGPGPKAPSPGPKANASAASGDRSAARPSPRPRPRSSRPAGNGRVVGRSSPTTTSEPGVDGLPTDKFQPVVPHTPDEVVEAT